MQVDFLHKTGISPSFCRDSQFNAHSAVESSATAEFWKQIFNKETEIYKEIFNNCIDLEHLQ